MELHKFNDHSTYESNSPCWYMHGQGTLYERVEVLVAVPCLLTSLQQQTIRRGNRQTSYLYGRIGKKNNNNKSVSLKVGLLINSKIMCRLKAYVTLSFSAPPPALTG